MRDAAPSPCSHAPKHLTPMTHILRAPLLVAEELQHGPSQGLPYAIHLCWLPYADSHIPARHSAHLPDSLTPGHFTRHDIKT